MGQASEMMIEQHNARMESDEDYREQIYSNERDYYESLEANIELEKQMEKQTDWFSDYRLAHDGFEEFVCDLCGKGCDNDFGHGDCYDREKAWADMA